MHDLVRDTITLLKHDRLNLVIVSSEIKLHRYLMAMSYSDGEWIMASSHNHSFNN